MKDLFSADSNSYARYRPLYPVELFQFIYTKIDCFDLAWDCGTGSGQSAVALAKKFKRVYATDISEQQLVNASKANNIAYAKEPAESTMLADKSVDLITVAQALHWFDLPAFYKEVNRIAKPDAVLVAWTYNLLSVNKEVDALIHDFYFQTLEGYWDEARDYVDMGYANLPFPYLELESPTFFIETRWTIDDVIGYLNTWSGLKKFISVNNTNPTAQLREDLVRIWPVQDVKQIKFPLYLKIAKVSSFQENYFLL